MVLDFAQFINFHRSLRGLYKKGNYKTATIPFRNDYPLHILTQKFNLLRYFVFSPERTKTYFKDSYVPLINNL